MARPHSSKLTDSSSVDLTPLIDQDPFDLRVSMGAMVHWADSPAYRRELMRKISFPSDDVQMFLTVNQLALRGAMRPTMLADGIQTGRANITRIVGRLEAVSLVAKVRDPEDDRAILIALTGLGRSMGAQIVEQLDAEAREAFADWPNDEVQTFKRLMTKFALSVPTPYFPSVIASDQSVPAPR